MPVFGNRNKKRKTMAKVGPLKLSVLKFIYFVYFESEKLPEDFNEYEQRYSFLMFVEQEKTRFESMSSFGVDYCVYLETLLKIINCYVKNFINSSSQGNKD